MRRQVYRLTHDPLVQAAISEFAKAELVVQGAPKAIRRVAELMDSDDGRVAIKAVQLVMDRVGLHGKSEQEITHKVELNYEEKMAKLVSMAGMLGIDPATLVGQITIDEQAQEIEP